VCRGRGGWCGIIKKRHYQGEACLPALGGELSWTILAIDLLLLFLGVGAKARETRRPLYDRYLVDLVHFFPQETNQDGRLPKDLQHSQLAFTIDAAFGL